MLNAKLIGSYISSLRKEKDLTQVELADQVNVSHQAVSKWERGESLPDIGTLIDLGRLFETSVDNLLSAGKYDRTFQNVGSILKEIADDRPEQAAGLLNEGKAEVDGFVSLAPLLKTSTLDKVTKRIENHALSLEHLVELAPFLERSLLDELITNVNKDIISMDQIQLLAPFIDRSTVSELIVQNGSPFNIKEIIQIAPFIDGKLDHFIRDADCSALYFDEICSLAPFVKVETLVNVVDHAMDTTLSLDQIIKLAPFLGDHVERFIERSGTETISWKELKRLAPFVKKETLAALIEKAPAENLSQHELLELAPFLGGKLDEMINETDLAGCTADTIVELTPFVSKDTLRTLMTKITN